MLGWFCQPRVSRDGEEASSATVAPRGWLCLRNTGTAPEDAEAVRTAVGLPGSLIEAAKEGDLQQVERLLEKRVDINVLNGEEDDRACANATPLILAARAGHEGVVRRLLEESDVKVNAASTNLDNSMRSGQTALHWAAREGKYGCAMALMNDPRAELELKTQLGTTPLWLANQQGNVDILSALIAKKADARIAITGMKGEKFNTMVAALFEGQHESLRVLITEGIYGIDDVIDLQTVKHTPLGCSAKSNWLDHTKTLLKLRADVNVEVDGVCAFDLAYAGHSVEIMMNLLAHGCDTSHILTKVRHAQIVGDAASLAKLIQRKEIVEKDRIPALHLATVKNDTAALKKAFDAFLDPHAARYTLDGGSMNAVFYAVELGQILALRLLMKEVHALSDQLCDVVVRAITLKNHTFTTGERMFRAIYALFGTTASEERHHAKGMAALIQPWMGSVPALQYFQAEPEQFHSLRSRCEERSQAIYDRIDKEVTYPVLVSLASMGQEYLEKPARQDDPTILPEMKFLYDEKKGQTAGGDFERLFAMDLALLALATDEQFKDQMDKLFDPICKKVHHAPPKTYNRMKNKLLNPKDHGDSSIPKPRPAKNVDVIRCGIEVAKPEDVLKCFKALEARYRILRVKNSHNPQEGGFGGYRCMLVNFVFPTELTYGELFGIGRFDPTLGLEEGWLRDDDIADMWYDYIMELPQSWEWKWALSALWYVARNQPDRKVVLSGEVQIIYEPYMIGRSLSHLLFKISRCETGPDEMVRDFAPSFTESNAKEASQGVKGILKSAVRRRLSVPSVP